MEILLRTAIFKPANALVAQLLQRAAERAEAAYQPRPGEERRASVPLIITCLFGSFMLLRRYYYHPGKRKGHYPADAALGLETSYTPALARLLCLEGADESSYGKAAEHLREVGGIEIDERQIHRVINRVGGAALKWQNREVPAQNSDAEVLYISADATGAPMRRKELVGVRGQGENGQAKTRMVNLGCVFSQLKTDADGNPMRDHDSTTYLTSFESISDFGIYLRREAIGRGLATVPKTVLLVDGASGLEKLGRDYFPEAVQIVDFYHACEHLKNLSSLLLGHRGQRIVERRRKNWKKRLFNGGVKKIIALAQKEALEIGKVAEVEKALGYFLNNIDRMQYGAFRKQGFFIGSGVVEAGCRSVVGARCKQSGMFWSVEGAGNILAFRCIHSSRRLNEFWKDRRNNLAARNDALPLAA